MKQIVLSLAAALLLFGMGPAFACEGDVMYEDSFDEDDGTWSTDGDILKVEDGKLIFSPKPNYADSRVSFAEVFDDVDLCVSTTAIRAPDMEYATGQLIFWWDDWKNYYKLLMTPKGSFTVLRYARGRTLHPVPWTEHAGIKKGEGATNHLRVELVGNSVKVLINGEEAASFRGRPPKKGHLVGLSASSPEGARAVIAYDDFKAALPAEAVAMRKSAPSGQDASQKAELIKAARAAGSRSSTKDISPDLRQP